MTSSVAHEAKILVTAALQGHTPPGRKAWKKALRGLAAKVFAGEMTDAEFAAAAPRGPDGESPVALLDLWRAQAVTQADRDAHDEAQRPAATSADLYFDYLTNAQGLPARASIGGDGAWY